MEYGNEGKVAYSYDDFDRVTGITHDDATEPRFTTEYDAQGRVARVTDTSDGSTVMSEYDLTDRLTASEQRDGNGNVVYRTAINYDDKGRVKYSNGYTADGIHKNTYTYDTDNRVTEIKYNGSDTTKVAYTYDRLNRITARTVTNGVPYATAYAYVSGSDAYGAGATTPLVASIAQGSGANAFNFSYAYDRRGNITRETRNGVTTSYEYDAIGQLTRVNDPNDSTGGANGTTWLYAYDRGGNILSKTAYAYTTDTPGTAIRTWPYVYGDANWKDKLTSFDGHAITYDAIGNPLSDGTWTYVWEAGRLLRSMTNAGTGVTMEFTYDHAGLRTKKVKKVNGEVTETTEYIWSGKQLAGLVKGTDTLYFYYDAQGKASMVKYNGTMYSYVHNLQGDIVGIVDASGNVVAEYKYDAWGKLIVNVYGILAEMNPLRYRSYILDDETASYYIKSRIYNPMISRFISSDSCYREEDKNLYAYTNNMIVLFKDETGHDTYAIGVTTTVVVGVISVVIAKGICWDDCGNFGTFITYCGLEGDLLIEGSNTATVDVFCLSANMFYQQTALNHITDLEGNTYGMGASIPVGIDVGYDLVLSGDNYMDSEIIGGQTSVGFGFGVPFVPHASKTFTQVTVMSKAETHQITCPEFKTTAKSDSSNVGVIGDFYPPQMFIKKHLNC